MHSWVDYCMCPDQGSNLQPWHIGTTPQPTELPGQGRGAQLSIRDPAHVCLAAATLARPAESRQENVVGLPNHPENFEAQLHLMSKAGEHLQPLAAVPSLLQSQGNASKGAEICAQVSILNAQTAVADFWSSDGPWESILSQGLLPQAHLDLSSPILGGQPGDLKEGLETTFFRGPALHRCQGLHSPSSLTPSSCTLRPIFLVIGPCGSKGEKGT